MALRQFHRRGCEGMSSTLGMEASYALPYIWRPGLTNVDAELEEFSMNPGAPHSGLATLMARINCQISSATFGLPPRDRDFHRHNKRKPARCQRITVSGSMITKAFTMRGTML